MSVNEIDQLIGRHRGSRTLIVGPGPSLSEMEVALSSEDYDIAIFVGDSYLRTALRTPFNYYLRQNTESPRLDNSQDVRHLSSFDSLIIASSLMESEVGVETLARNNLPSVDVFLFDQRHFGLADCDPVSACCGFKRDRTIQEVFANHFGLSFLYSQGTSTVTHAFSVAMLFGASKIHFIGVDLPLRIGQYVYSGEAKSPHMKLRPTAGSLLKLLKTPAPAIVRHIRRQLAVIALGPLAPSAFAEGFTTLFTDLQLFVILCVVNEIEVGVYGSESLLLKMHGTKKL